jgi:hypothetical protein
VQKQTVSKVLYTESERACNAIAEPLTRSFVFDQTYLFKLLGFESLLYFIEDL